MGSNRRHASIGPMSSSAICGTMKSLLNTSTISHKTTKVVTRKNRSTPPRMRGTICWLDCLSQPTASANVAGATSGMNLTRQKSHQRQFCPLTGSKRLNELFFCVLKRRADRIHGGNWHAYTSNPDVEQGTAKAGRGQLDSE